MKFDIPKDWSEQAARREDGSDIQAGALAADPVICEPMKHDWKEEYYGHRCTNCDAFYAFGCAPWDDNGQDH